MVLALGPAVYSRESTDLSGGTCHRHTGQQNTVPVPLLRTIAAAHPQAARPTIEVDQCAANVTLD